ncbi:MAG: DPP IV N-terminal domain-containing protein [Flavobacteriia bacterium]|nr:DPP IV N-terminal domain-containing protein [Flavobacteriia bacterium]
MKKWFVIGFVILLLPIYAQKKVELTLEQAVLEQNRMFGVDKLRMFQWIPGTESYTYMEKVDKTWVLKIASVSNAVAIDLITLNDLNLALNCKLFSFYGLEWKDKNTFYINDGLNFYKYDVTAKKGLKIYSIDENAGDVSFNKVNESVVYTVENNLIYKNSKGERIAITSNSDKNIISGQTYARSEFGIHGGIFVSPKNDLIAFAQKDESEVAEYPLVDITTTPGSLMSTKYPMAGQKSEKPRIGIYSIANGKTVFITPKGKSDDYLTNVSWTPDEKFILIAEVNREQNHMWLNKYDAISGAFVKTLFEETNDKWIEPEHPAFFPSNDKNSFVWISERDGFNNLYYYDIEGVLIKKLTSNKFVVKDIFSSINKGSEIIFSATGDSPLNTMYYGVNLKGTQRLLTKEEGVHSVFISPDEKWFFDEYTNHLTPSLSVMTSMNGKSTNILLESKNKYKEVKMGTSEISTITKADGTILYTRLIKPSNFDPSKKYPVLVYVYGGPHAQMITNSWLDGANLWMFWMAEQGYLVYTLDNRGSGERGFAFESGIHRQLGNIEMEDQLEGVKYLKSLPYVDGNRLAVHGWSFGGFMTTSLMLRQPDVFNVGVAGGPVIDWKWYEVMYGERYMDKPEENLKGYEEASLLNYAKNLKGDLLLIHGTVDDVVVMQHNFAMVKKFVEAGVQMDFFPYPMHKHNVGGKDRVHLMTKVLNYVIENNK